MSVESKLLDLEINYNVQNEIIVKVGADKREVQVNSLSDSKLFSDLVRMWTFSFDTDYPPNFKHVFCQFDNGDLINIVVPYRVEAAYAKTDSLE